MGVITLPTTLQDNTVPTAAQFMGNFNAIVNEFNGSISNSNISPTAAIATTKIAGTAATLTGSETLSNKILTKPTVNGSIQGVATYTPSIGGTATLDLSAANFHLITMPAGNITIALSNVSSSQPFYIRILQDSGGSRTVTWFTTITWIGATAPTLTTTANRADAFVFYPKSASTFDGYIAGQNIG